jgi:hypothetical protein
MLALTVFQPWATLIVFGHKTLETRKYHPRYRGRIAIHASRSDRGLQWAAHCLSLGKFMREQGLDMHSLPMGAVLGECELGDVTETEQNSDLQACGWLIAGRYTWHLSGAIAYSSPIRAMGFVRLWPWERPHT